MANLVEGYLAPWKRQTGIILVHARSGGIRTSRIRLTTLFSSKLGQKPQIMGHMNWPLSVTHGPILSTYGRTVRCNSVYIDKKIAKRNPLRIKCCALSLILKGAFVL